MTQLDLLARTPTPPAEPTSPTLEQRFEAFHAANPRVFDRMLRLSRARLDRGEKFISVKALWEELRASLASSALAYDDEPEFKLNNNHTALYARLLLETEPRLVGVIETRKRKAK